MKMDAWEVSKKILKQEVKRMSLKSIDNDIEFGEDLELDIIISEFAIALSEGNDDLILKFKADVYGN